jgi:hypothetical protein
LRFDRLAALALALLLLATYVKRFHWDERLLYLGHTAFHSLEELEDERALLNSAETFKGRQDLFSIVWSDNKPYFFINGYTSINMNSPAEKVVGAFSSVFAPRSDRALVLGLGSGATASTVGQIFDRTDVVEINEAVIANLERMRKYNFGIRDNPRVRVIHDDGIHYVKATDAEYSLILNTVTTPLYFSSSKLYTRDFLQFVRERLSPNGVYVTWLDSRVGDRGVDIMLKTLDDAFEQCAIGYVKEYYLLVLCSQVPLQANQPRVVADHPILGSYFLREFGIRPEWLPYELLRTNTHELVKGSDAPLNTLDRPALEFEMARLRKRGFGTFLDRLARGMRLSDVERSLAPMADWSPVHLVIHAELMLGDSPYTERWTELVRDVVVDFDEERSRERSHFDRDYAAALAGESSADAYYRQGVHLQRTDRYSEAIDAFEKALERDPQRDNSYFRIGECYEYWGDYPQALENYRAELSVDPEDSDVPYRVGRVLVKMERYQDAIQELERSPDQANSILHYYRGRAYEGLGDVPAAIHAYEESRSQDPEDEDVVEALTRLRNHSPKSGT